VVTKLDMDSGRGVRRMKQFLNSRDDGLEVDGKVYSLSLRRCPLYAKGGKQGERRAKWMDSCGGIRMAS